jgi:2-haloacid dehalogenase
MSLGGVTALVFDVFGTLVDWRGGVARDARSFLARHGADEIEPTGFADLWRSLYSASMEPVRRGTRPYTQLDVLHRESLEAILPSVGIDPQQVPAAELDALTLAWHRLDPWSDVVPALARLKRRFIIAPLSNGNIRLMIDLAKRSGLPWDAILGAETVRTYKPAPEAYLRTAEILALAPSDICLVAAHNSDLAAARQCGFKTCFVPRLTEHGPNQVSDLVPAEAWDAVVPDLGALADLLEC